VSELRDSAELFRFGDAETSGSRGDACDDGRRLDCRPSMCTRILAFLPQPHSLSPRRLSAGARLRRRPRTERSSLHRVGPAQLRPRVGTDQASWRTHEAMYNASFGKGRRRVRPRPRRAMRQRRRDRLELPAARRRPVPQRPPFSSTDVVFTYRSSFGGFPSGKKERSAHRRSSRRRPRDVEFRLASRMPRFRCSSSSASFPTARPTTTRRSVPSDGPFRFVGYRPRRPRRLWRGSTGTSRAPRGRRGSSS